MPEPMRRSNRRVIVLRRPIAGIVVLVLWLVACGTAAHAWQLRDDDGTVVRGPGASAQRLVALAPGLAELVFAAGAGSRLVGTASYSDYPAAARAVPRIGDAFAVNLEALLAVHPDLVLVWGSGNPTEWVARIRKLGIAVAVLRTRELDDVAAHLRLIGAVAGTGDVADAAAARYRQALDGLRKRYSGRPPLRVFYQISLHPLFTVNGEQFIGRVLTLCGGRNVFAGLAAPAPRVSVEAVLAADPQVILFSRNADTQAVRDFWNRLSTLSAVRDDALYAVAADQLVRPTPRLIGGIRSVCRALDRARDSTLSPALSRQRATGDLWERRKPR